jgi:cathepsin D
LKQATSLRNKYHIPTHLARRQDSAGIGASQLVNVNADSTYYGTALVGTPPKPFNLILDTGSSDMWIAHTSCAICSNVPQFDESLSSTFVATRTPFSIQYGSGAAAGVMGSDVVQMGGFEVPNQPFAIADQVSDGLLDNEISGLLGLGFGTIASSRTTPLAQTLAQQGALQEPLFSFFLTRFLDVLRTGDNVAQFGGEFMLGGVNPALFDGPIDFVDIPKGREGFWGLEMSTLLVNGINIPIPAVESFSAIDTGTTLVGGPAELIAAIYAQIPGAERGDGQLEGFWQYPCDTPIAIELAFGPKGQHQSWHINPADMELLRSGSTCVGAFFEIDLGSNPNNPAWIVGDTFLKSVYNVYRFDPPAVGFAKLSATALSFNGAIGLDLPSATAVADPIRATAIKAGPNLSNNNRKGDGSDAAPQNVVSSVLVAAAALSVGLFMV